MDTERPPFTETTVTVTKTVYGGYGLAHVDGYTCFVPYTLPGETVTVQPYGVRKKTIFAKPVTIEIPSKHRIKPPCPVFGTCGGCTFQHASYECEIEEKKSHISDILTRLGKVQDIPPIRTVHDDRFGYRTVAGIKYSNGSYGFYRSGSHDVVPFPPEGCRLLNGTITDFLQKQKLPKDDFRISSGHDGVCVTSPDALVEDEVNGYVYRRKNRSFFQANGLLRGRMVDEVVSMAREEDADTLIDAGCGCGFFSLPLSRVFGHVTGFDTDAAAVRSARKNARDNGVSNATFIRGSFDEINTKGVSLCLADPPRSGLTKRFIHSLVHSDIETVIYVACDPAHFARDITRLEGVFRLDRITFIDMFPATNHIELVSLLKRV
ncbi:MAG: class I SAM-dependent RNA methyltransferase [Spirochaetota bacterium]